MTRINCIVNSDGNSNTATIAQFTDGCARTKTSLFAFDAIWLKPANCGDQMTEVRGARRGFIKICVGADAKTKKNRAVLITDDRCWNCSLWNWQSRLLQMQNNRQM